MISHNIELWSCCCNVMFCWVHHYLDATSTCTSAPSTAADPQCLLLTVATLEMAQGARQRAHLASNSPDPNLIKQLREVPEQVRSTEAPRLNPQRRSATRHNRKSPEVLPQNTEIALAARWASTRGGFNVVADQFMIIMFFYLKVLHAASNLDANVMKCMKCNF